MPVVDGKFTIDNQLSKDGSAYEKLRDSIKRNETFNKKLVSEPSPEPTEFQIRMNKIGQVLKDKGMDSQQRTQALSMIEEILNG